MRNNFPKNKNLKSRNFSKNNKGIIFNCFKNHRIENSRVWGQEK